MKKEKEQIATNTSSGAEKVEVIERETKTAPVKPTQKSNAPKKKATAVKKTQTIGETSAKGEAALGSESKKKEEKISAKKINARSSGSKAEKESAAAKARVERALKKKEAKEKRKAEKAARLAKKKEERQKRAAEKKAQIEKRAAAKKALVEKRAAEKKALAEKRAAEKEAKLRERAHGKANRRQAQARKKTAKEKNRKEKRQTRQEGKGERRQNRGHGYGGWIAAVVSLGVVTLALATTVTVGAVEMSRMNDGMMAAYKGTMYELTGVMEHVDSDLDRVRVSASPEQQSRILTDLLVQARLAEGDLEKLPIAAEADRNVTSFINRIAAESERMLAKLRKGEKLSDKDLESLENLYRVNHSIRQELDKLVNAMTDKDLMGYMKEGEGMMADVLGNLEKSTLEENRAALKGGAEMPKASQKKSGEGTRVEPSKAEALCKKYFSSYKVSEFQCVGETVTGAYAAYNVQGYDDKGSMLFAEISQEDGALIRFDYYEDCMGENFDIQNAERVAEQFLEKLGYDDLEVVRLRKNGTTVDFTFVYEDDDVVYYPDEVRVKVCRTRGVVSGMDASKYLANHKEREEVEPTITLAEAQDKLHRKLTVNASRLSVVKAGKEERAAYEFFCSYAGDNYFVYVDANSGAEIAIVNAKNIE